MADDGNPYLKLKKQPQPIAKPVQPQQQTPAVTPAVVQQAAAGAPPMMPPRTPTPGTGYGDSWWDLAPGTAGFGKPARPGPQTPFDWFSKTYHQDPADAATIMGDAASYHLAPLALRGVEALNQSGKKSSAPIPTGVSAQGARDAIQGAYDRAGPAGPIWQAAGYAASPLTWSSLGPVSLVGRGLAAAVEHLAPAAAPKIASYILPKLFAKNVPENLLPTMAKGGNFAGMAAAGQEAGSKDSTPLSTAEAYAKNFPIGAGIDAFVGTLPMGRNSPADVTRSTQATLNQAGQSTRVPGKSLGFTINAGPQGPMETNPTLGSLEDLRTFLQTQRQKAGLAPMQTKPAVEEGAPMASPRSAFDPVRPEEPGYGRSAPSNGGDPLASPALMQDVRSANAPKDIYAQLLDKIANALPESKDAAFLKAKQQADAAQQLQLMRSNAGLPGPLGDIRAQAAEQAQNFPPDTPLNTSWQTIARTPDQPPKAVSNRARSYLTSGGAALGELGGTFFGYPHLGGAPGAFAGNEAANAAEWMFGGPKDPTGHLQAAIDRQYPALTGQKVGPGGAGMLSDMLKYGWGPGDWSQ